MVIIPFFFVAEHENVNFIFYMISPLRNTIDFMKSIYFKEEEKPKFVTMVDIDEAVIRSCRYRPGQIPC